MKLSKILYFSLNKNSVDSFYRYNEKKRACEILSFSLFPQAGDHGEKGIGTFSHASDLISFLDKKEKQDSLPNFVIIDYISLTDPKSMDNADSVFHAREIVLRAILKYPEINFLFDETRLNDKESFNYLDFLFVEKSFLKGLDIIEEYHSFNATSDIKQTYKAIEHGRDNLFDGSNLRYAARRFVQTVLKVNRYNFSLFQDSRRDYLALCVEEEHSQNRFNSYALFANGFRVLPVVTAKELTFFNDEEFSKKHKSPSIIVRDYDLQFPDTEGKSVEIIIDGGKYKINEVDYIRGVKFWDAEEGKESSCPNSYKNKWFVPHEELSDPKEKDNYRYWSNLCKVPIYFISKGVGGIEFCNTRLKEQRKCETNPSSSQNDSNSPFQDKVEKQVVRGIKKPVSGVYCPFFHFEDVRERYHSFCVTSLTTFVLRDARRINKKMDELKAGDTNDNQLDSKSLKEVLFEKYQIQKMRWFDRWWLRICLKMKGPNGKESISKDVWRDELKNQAWVIDTSRENHDHGVPLDVYDLVQSMLCRARQYYEKGKYVRAAVISSETIELLNGFHESLMLQAYHIWAISENAIAMNTIGGDERLLKEDCIFRINNIECEVDRILTRSKEEGQSRLERKELKYNVLNQIFSDCRKFCRDKEHFTAEDCFISAMAHVNEGYTPWDIFREGQAFFKRVLNSWTAQKDLINNL